MGGGRGGKRGVKGVERGVGGEQEVRGEVRVGDERRGWGGGGGVGWVELGLVEGERGEGERKGMVSGRALKSVR